VVVEHSAGTDSDDFEIFLDEKSVIPQVISQVK